MLILEKVRQSIQQHSLLKSGETVIVGVSGGYDSLALLHMLCRLQESLGISLHVATLDHGWRGNESAADAQFVADVAAQYDLPVTIRTMQSENLDTNLEATGRRARYDFFSSLANEIGTDLVATAHHADDQAETILMHIIRGTSLDGLRGMRWKTALPYHPEQTLIRPLLSLTRDEIEDYCKSFDLNPREDPTNQDVRFFRNRVRLQVLPYLQEINPNIAESLIRLGNLASLDYEFLNDHVDQFIEQHVDKQDSWLLMSRTAFRQIHPALQQRVIVSLATSLNPDVEVDYEHVIVARDICLGGDQGAVVQFSGKGRVRVDYENCIFELEQGAPMMPPLYIDLETHINLTPPETVHLGGGYMSISEAVPDGFQVVGEMFISDHVHLFIRTRRPGDRIAPPGMQGHTQKLSDWFINRKIPQYQRDAIPLLLQEDEYILAVLHPTLGIVAHPYHQPDMLRRKYYISFQL